MENNEFSLLNIENRLKNRPRFSQVKGTYTLFLNIPSKSFACSEEDLESCITNILEALVVLSSVKAQNAPLEWAPLPNKDKEFFMNKFQSEPHLYLEFLHSDPSLIRIKKNSDDGRSIFWK